MTEMELYQKIFDILWDVGSGAMNEGRALDKIMELINEYTTNIVENGKQES